MIQIPSWLIKLFKFLYKGAKIEATLIPAGGGRRPMREYPKPGAIGKGVGVIMYEQSDITRDWEVKKGYKLILSNNSTYDAYDITFPNIKECFDETTFIKQPLIIKAGEQFEIGVTYNQYITVPTGPETEILPPIPVDKEGKTLRIKYKNEAGTRLTTLFFISLSNPRNIFAYGK